MKVDFAGLLDVQLGLTDLCNLSCVMCQQTADRAVYGAPGRRAAPLHGGRRGFMERGTLERFVDSLVADRYPLRVLSLMWIGESLLHPEFPAILDHLFARWRDFPFAAHFVLNTNATLLGEEVRAVLLGRKADPASPPFTLVLSLDAATPATFRAIKGADGFAAACGNAERLLEEGAALRTPPDRPLTTVLQTLVLPENAHEMEAFRDRWAGFLDRLGRPFDLCHDTLHGAADVKIYFKRASSADQEPLERLHRDVAARLGLLHDFSERPGGRVVEFDSDFEPAPPERRRPCPAPFRTAAIDWDGTVTPCCVDVERQLPLGNVGETAFRAIILGRAAEELRLDHIEGRLAHRPVCRDCRNLHYPAVPDADLVAWLVARGMPERGRPFVERMTRAGKRRARVHYTIARPMDFRGTKKTLILELSARCNLRCVMCEQSFDPTRADKGLMDPALFRRLIDELVDRECRANCVNAFWSGESLVHPAFVEMIEYAAARNFDFRGFGALDLHTNGNLLDERVARAVIAGRQFARLLVSLDAATPATYAAIRRGGDFDRVVANVERLVALRDRAGADRPRVTLQFVVSAANRREARPFLDLADRILGAGRYQVNHDWTLPAPFSGDVVFFKRLDEVETAAQVEAERLHREVAVDLGLLPPEAPGRAVISDEHRVDASGGNPLTGRPAVRRPCVGLFTHMAVRWNGDVSACCRDIKCALKLGNAAETPLLALWNSDRLTRLRLAHLEGRADEIPACRGCPNQICPVLEDHEAVDYLRSVGRADLIAPYLARVGAHRDA